MPTLYYSHMHNDSVTPSFSMAFCRHVHLAILTLKICRKDIVDLHLVPNYLHVQFVHSVNLPNNFLLHIPLEQNMYRVSPYPYLLCEEVVMPD